VATCGAEVLRDAMSTDRPAGAFEQRQGDEVPHSPRCCAPGTGEPTLNTPNVEECLSRRQPTSLLVFFQVYL